MKTEQHPSGSTNWWPLYCLGLLLVGVAIYVLLPHRTQTIESHSILQNGIKMDAHFTLQSPWGWAPPSRIVEMSVTIDGKDVSIAESGYQGVSPINPAIQPVIAERRGFPMIILRGMAKDPLSEADWYFQNYTFSERRIVRDHREQVSYYADPHPTILASTAISITGLDNSTSVTPASKAQGDVPQK
jgi:hypothetical protein